MAKPGCVRENAETYAVFAHAGAGFHSFANEEAHLAACRDAVVAAMACLAAGASAVDAVEIAIKVLEDREITNAGYGSNLTKDGIVEGDASIVDHLGRSGAVGAVAQIKNPISLARLVYEHSMKPLSLRRVPPNLLVAQGATDFASDSGMAILPFDALISPSARERWRKWTEDLEIVEAKARRASQMRGHQIHHPVPNTSSASSPISTSSSGRDNDIEYEDRIRNIIRREHTRAMLNQGSANIGSVSPASSDFEQSDDYFPSKSPTASSKSTLDTSISDIDDNVYVDPRDPSQMLEEPSESPFLNSTQQVPTLASYHSSQHNFQVPASFGRSSRRSQRGAEVNDFQPDSKTSQAVIRPRVRAWADGSSGEDSESSSATIQLPSLTPSPPPSTANETVQRATSLKGSTSQTLEKKSHKINQPLRSQAPSRAAEALRTDDNITDTVGVIAVDSKGNIACGASSGGIGLKFRGRIGPAALVGVGAAVIPVHPEDEMKTCVATVTSGTGEHITTTMAATLCSERLYHGKKKSGQGDLEDVSDDYAIKYMIQNEFSGHPSMRSSQPGSGGAIGILTVKKDRDGISLYFAHNTESFALASMSSNEAEPQCTMSRKSADNEIAFGGRRFRRG